MLKDLCVLPSSGNSVLKKKREKEWGKPLGSYIRHNIKALLRLEEFKNTYSTNYHKYMIKWTSFCPSVFQNEESAWLLFKLFSPLTSHTNPNYLSVLQPIMITVVLMGGWVFWLVDSG